MIRKTEVQDQQPFIFLESGVNGLARSPAKKNYSDHSYPLDKIESAISYLKKDGKHQNWYCGSIHNGNLSSSCCFLVQRDNSHYRKDTW